MLLDNLCVILIDLSTAVLRHLNRLLADRTLNLCLKVIFHTRLSHGRQVADDPVADTSNPASAGDEQTRGLPWPPAARASPSRSQGLDPREQSGSRAGADTTVPTVPRDMQALMETRFPVVKQLSGPRG